MKRFFSFILAVLMVAVMCVSSFALTGENYVLFSSTSNVDIPVNQHIRGDANGDGAVDFLDAIAALRGLVGNNNNISRDGVDVDGDGDVTVADIVLILHHVLGSDVGLGELVE